jgi:simple sugar transport system permease protein
MLFKKIDNQTKQLMAICLILFAIMTFLRPGMFLRPININSMLEQLAEPGLFALAMSIAMIAGGINLSVVNIANLVGIINGIIIRTTLTPDATNAQTTIVLLICVLVALIIGLVCGLVNGLLIAKLGILPILATLGTQSLFMGISMIITQGRAEGNFPQILLDLGNKNLLGFEGFLGFPLVTVVFFTFFIFLCIVVHRTPYGLKLQFYGSNNRASFFSGIDNKRVVYTTHILSALIAAFTGLIIMARTNSAKADYGQTYVFETILICVLAGVTPLGGRGKVYNIILSLFALQIVSTGFNMMRISPLIRDSLFGFLLVFSILVDYVLRKRRMDKLNQSAIASAKAKNVNMQI